MKLIYFDAKCGRALSGWTNVQRGAFAPSFDFGSLTEEKRIAVKNLIAYLFSTSYCMRLETLFDTLFASLLSNLNYVTTQYGLSHIIPNQLITSAAMFGISYQELCEWGTEIRNAWISKNFEESFRKEENEKVDE
jgi:hypothetical protein